MSATDARSPDGFLHFINETSEDYLAIRVFSFPFLVLAGSAQAQTQKDIGGTAGDSTREFNQMTVELQPTAGGVMPTEKAFVSGDGRFSFPNLPPGSYFLVVRDREGTVVHQQYTSTQGPEGFSVRLPEPETKQRPVSGLVSVR